MLERNDYDSTIENYNRSLSQPEANAAPATGTPATETPGVPGTAPVEPHVTLIYKDVSGKEQQLLFMTKLAEKLKKKLDKKYQLQI